MRKLLTILILFCSAVCFSQAPKQLNAYTPQTQVNFLGTIGNDSGLVFRTNFADTTTANLGWVKNIPNVLVTINDTLYKRSNDVTHWMQVGSGSGGGGNTIYTGDGSLGGNRILDLGSNKFEIRQGGQSFLLIDPTVDAENSFIGSINNTGGGNSAGLSTLTPASIAQFQLGSNFNDGQKVTSIYGFADATVSSITYTADTHTFNGVHFNLANLQNFADNAAAITGGLSVGDLYYTNTAGDGILKIVL